AAPGLTQLHHRPHVARRRNHAGADVWLEEPLDRGGVGHLGGTVHLDAIATPELDLVPNVRGGCEELEVVFALEALAHDVHVKEAEEPAAKPEPKRLGGLGLVGEG